MRYNLSSNMAHRINFDEAMRAAADEDIRSYLAAGGEVEYFDPLAWWMPDQIDTDDEDEARARFIAVYQNRLTEIVAELDEG